MPRVGAMGPRNAREGKKQVMSYLVPEQAQAARRLAQADDKTLQELVGDAVNAVFEHHDMEGPVKSGRTRIIRRSTKAAAVKPAGSAPPCRTGRVSMAGWYPQHEVDEVTRMSRRLGVSIQAFVEAGMFLLTGVEAAGDEWRRALEPPGEGEPPVMRGRPPVMAENRKGREDFVAEAVQDALRRLSAR